MAYSKQTWVTGETITASKLNHMEDGIDEISANGAIGTANLANASVTNAKLDQGAVDTSNIANGAVGTTEIQDGAVTTPKIAGGAVTTAKIADGAVTDAKLAQSGGVLSEVADLKSALTDITGNTAISGWVDGKFVSTNGSTYNPSGAVVNANFRYVFVDCSPGDVFTISGTGGGNPRLWAFADSSNNILSKSAVDATADKLLITAPQSASRLILNDKAKTAQSYYGNTIKNRVSALETETAEIEATVSAHTVNADKRFQTVDGKMYLDPENFELGDILISSNGWTYQNSTRRVRTKENYDLELEVGDVIRLKSYDAARLYIGYQTTATTYGANGWLTEDIVCKYGGKYAILIDSVPSAIQSDKYALFDLLEIIKYNNNTNSIKIQASRNPAIASANHRGMNRNAPENTLPAFQQSKRYGFDYVETDIAWTSDGVPVLLHDSTINRTARNSDGTAISDEISIANITYEQALTYDFGVWKAEKWAGTKIPTFEQLLTMCKKQGIKVLAEIKSFGYTGARMTALMDMVKSLGAESLVMWISFEYSILAYINNLDSSANLGLLSASVTAEVISKAQALQTTENKVVLMSDVYTSEAISLCKNADVPLWVYTINSKTTMNGLPLYLCGVTSDLYPVNVVWGESVT